MLTKILKIIIISRYRFWAYTAGPFLLGWAFGFSLPLTNFITPAFLVQLFFFLIPANIFIYGINDLFDQDTDKFNLKKQNKENLLKTRDELILKLCLLISLLISLQIIFTTQNIAAKLILIIFLILSFFYSAPPLRFKSHPLMDSLSNILYILPGVFGFIVSSGKLPPILPLLGYGCWAAAMHLFSAIPDIKPDKKAKLKTTAVVLGERYSLILCFLLWLIFYAVTFYFFDNIFLLPLIIYPLIPLLLLIKNKWSINKIYWLFPYINTLAGFLAFILIILNK